MDTSNNEIIMEDYLENLGREMVHLAKFEYIPNYASKSWVNTVLKESRDFIEEWNRTKKIRDKYTTDKEIEDMLDKAYQIGLNDEGSNDISKLPKERPKDFSFEMITDQDVISKYMNQRLVDQNLFPTIYRLGVKYRTKMKFDRYGHKPKKYR